MALHDNEEKKKRGYTCKHSIVYMDGREKLSGCDWKRRVAQLQIRAGNQCENWLTFAGEPVARCKADGVDPHHVVPRSKLRDDRLENLAWLCRECHNKYDWKHLRWTKR